MSILYIIFCLTRRFSNIRYYLSYILVFTLLKLKFHIGMPELLGLEKICTRTIICLFICLKTYHIHGEIAFIFPWRHKTKYCKATYGVGVHYYIWLLHFCFWQVFLSILLVLILPSSAKVFDIFDAIRYFHINFISVPCLVNLFLLLLPYCRFIPGQAPYRLIHGRSRCYSLGFIIITPI